MNCAAMEYRLIIPIPSKFYRILFCIQFFQLCEIILVLFGLIWLKNKKYPFQSYILKIFDVSGITSPIFKKNLKIK